VAGALPQNIFFAAGGDVLQKYNTLVKRYAPPGRGGEIAYTFSRTGTAWSIGRSGQMMQNAGGIARIEWLTDSVSGLLQPYLKLEAAATNTCLQSQALNTSPWALTLATATNNAAAAPDGTTTATAIFPTAVSSAGHFDNQTFTITAGEFLAGSCFLQKGAYTGARVQVSNNAANAFQVAIDLSTGTLTPLASSGSGTLTGSTIIPLANGWYWVGLWGKVDGSSTTGALTVYAFDTGTDAVNNTAFTGTGTSGILVWGTQIERNGTTVALPPTSYIATTTTTVTRNADSFSVPWYVVPGPIWIYARFLERGSVNANGSGGPFLIGSGSTPFSRVDTFANPGYRFSHQTTTGAVVSTPSGIPTFGQVTELLCSIFADGSVQERQSINGAADSVGAQSAALAFASQWSALTLTLGQGGYFPISRLVIGTGPGTIVSTIADVRAIPL
jgi:hypothetical protein